VSERTGIDEKIVQQVKVQHVIAKTPEQARAAAVSYMKQYEGQSGAAAVYSKLQEHGVKVVNGYSGGAVLPLLDQFHEENPRHFLPGAKKPIRWITNSNEQNAGHVTEGFAKACPVDGEHLPVGVCVATSGPGVTNLITPLQDAMCDGVPMVILCGQDPTTAPEDAFQSAPAVAMIQPCTSLMEHLIQKSFLDKSTIDFARLADRQWKDLGNSKEGLMKQDMSTIVFLSCLHRLFRSLPYLLLCSKPAVPPVCGCTEF
jgi:hypothetical protein